MKGPQHAFELGATASNQDASVTPLKPETRKAHTAPLDRAALKERRVTLPDDTGPTASAYRMLRAQFLRRIRADNLRTVGVVSAVDGEGKTLTATNLALSLAADPNQSVLLVDLDLHHPSVGNLVGLPATRGLETWFDGSTEIDSLFWRLGGLSRLSILPTCAACVGASELLASPRTQALLDELETRYTDRIVLLDLPPVLLTDDVLAIASLLDGVVLVASEGRTRREDLERVSEVIGSVRLVGTVLNCASESERRAY